MRMRFSGARGREQKCTQGLVGKIEEKRPLGKTRFIIADNIKIDLKAIRQMAGCC